MRVRAFAVGVTLLALLGGTAAAGPSFAAVPGAVGAPTGTPTGAPSPGPARGDHTEPTDALVEAARLLTATDAEPEHDHDGPHTELTLAMRDLFLARPGMGFFDGVRADLLLARPDSPLYDTTGEGYRGASDRVCGKRLCVHWAEKGEDAPDRRSWVRRTLRVLSSVWTYEVGTLGLRHPPSDGRRGGDRRFDVYLAELGDRGLFGYCTPERQVRGSEFSASGYCVLDNDFARKQYHAAPIDSLRVTAAHEFFHAIQFGYDFREDPWLLESTATWIEERFADGSNDNRRYLEFGSVHRPGRSLDHFSNTDYAQYGNWAFWEFLSERYGAGIVNDVWARADARGDAPDDYSVEALANVLRGRDGLRDVLAAYAVANLDPARTYPEGATWPRARTTRRFRVGAGEPREETLRVDHLSAAHVLLRPAEDLAAGALLRVKVDGPSTKASPAAVVTVRRRDGSSFRRAVALDGKGTGAVRVVFAPGRIDEVVVTVVNASRRYTCGEHTMLACGGRSLDQNRRFAVTARVTRK